MTAIVGLKDKGKVWIGGDSLASDCTGVYPLANEKVFKNKQFLIGFAGVYRSGQVLQYIFTPPLHPKKMDTMKYMVSKFIPGLKKHFKDKDADEILTFLVGYKKRLFIIDAGFSVCESATGYDACGDGGDVAVGAVAVAQGTPEERIIQALETAEIHCPSVRKPFIVKNL